MRYPGTGARKSRVSSRSVYPHRAAVPADLWARMLKGAGERVDVVVYAGPFLSEQNARLLALLRERAEAGAKVRMLGDPECAAIAERGAEEGIGDAMAGKIRNVLVLYQPIADVPGIEVRLHATTLYNSVFRFDEDMLVNTHIYGVPAAHAPVLHLRKLSAGDLFDTYADSFERVWAVALGFWSALREVFPQASEARCWFHKTANVLTALPKSAHPGARKALAEIWNAEDKPHARAAVKAFEAAYGAKFPKATVKITDDVEELLAFYDYPADRWVHLRTTNPIESTFATVRHRTKITNGPGSGAAGLAMAFKLIESAQDRWRARIHRQESCLRLVIPRLFRIMEPRWTAPGTRTRQFSGGANH